MIEKNHAGDDEALRQTLFQFVEGTLIHGDFNITLDVVAEDVIGVGMGEQGSYYNKNEMRAILEAVNKEPQEEKAEYSVKYGKIDIRVFSPSCASINGEVNLTATVGGQSMTNSFMQIASARKENGKWLWFMIVATPISLTEDGIESYPLAFAENALAQLKEELQTDTYELMNESFSGGILCTYIKENYPLCFANDSFIEMLGYEREEFEEIFKDNTVKMSYPDDKEHMRKVSEKSENSSGDVENRARWVKKDGSPIWVEFRVRRTTDKYGNHIFLSVVMDISEIVNLQRKTEEQNQTIMSGIDYARRIQKNMLPTDSVFKKTFSDYSVIWSPRDIVGGDIYWLKTFDKGTVLCVCDCTGHGTPGALLTMLVVSAFEDMVNENNCNDTAQILWNLEQRLIGVFSVTAGTEEKSDTVAVRDGCDLAVLYIAKNRSVTISAGHTHVFVCDGKEVNRIRGQRLFVGEGKIKSKEDINVINIPANPDNKFYIASDGLFDQMGGTPPNPFGYKQFMRIILDNHNEKQSMISARIWEAFESYRGEQPRRDDFELITFKP